MPTVNVSLLDFNRALGSTTYNNVTTTRRVIVSYSVYYPGRCKLLPIFSISMYISTRVYFVLFVQLRGMATLDPLAVTDSIRSILECRSASL